MANPTVEIVGRWLLSLTDNRGTTRGDHARRSVQGPAGGRLTTTTDHLHKRIAWNDGK
jgi:hypothetical protein